MGVMYDYFAAPSDAAAAEMVMLEAGPGGQMPASPALQEAIRARDREAIRLALRPKARMSDSGVLVLDTKGIDPAVQMGTLEALLTGSNMTSLSVGHVPTTWSRATSNRAHGS
jgi:hypothetical protein